MAETKTKKPFKTAVGLVTKTTPFLLLNLLVYGLFFVATVIWLAAFGGLAYLFAERLPLISIISFIIGIGAPWPLLRLARRYILYLVQGAHIAVATKLLLVGELPDGQGQVAYGRTVVKQLFRDVSVLFLIDRMVDGTVKMFTRRFVRIVDMLPLGGAVSSLARIGATIINRSLSYVDEAILSYAIAKDQPNVWRSGRHGLILYAQAYKPILGTAVKIWLLGRVFWLVSLLVIGVPGILLTLMIVPEAEAMQLLFQLMVVIGALLFASLFTKAVFEPFAAIYTLTAYHRTIEGLEVNAVWDRRLQNVSKRFRELVGKAQEHDHEVDPLDTVDVPQHAISNGNGAAPQGTVGAAPAQGSAPAPQQGGPGALGALARGGGRGGLGGMLGGMISQATNGGGQQPVQQQPMQQPWTQQQPVQQQPVQGQTPQQQWAQQQPPAQQPVQGQAPQQQPWAQQQPPAQQQAYAGHGQQTGQASSWYQAPPDDAAPQGPDGVPAQGAGHQVPEQDPAHQAPPASPQHPTEPPQQH
jgi:hypothetical protein